MLKKFLLGRGINKAQEIVSKFIRHGLTTGGGALVAGGYATDGDVTTAAGAIATLLGVFWSVARAYLSEKVK